MSVICLSNWSILYWYSRRINSLLQPNDEFVLFSGLGGSSKYLHFQQLTCSKSMSSSLLLFAVFQFLRRNVCDAFCSKIKSSSNLHWVSKLVSSGLSLVSRLSGFLPWLSQQNLLPKSQININGQINQCSKSGNYSNLPQTMISKSLKNSSNTSSQLGLRLSKLNFKTLHKIQSSNSQVNIKILNPLEKSTNSGADKIKNELKQIKHEIERLSKNIETNMQPPPKDGNLKWWSSPSTQPSKSDHLPIPINNINQQIKKAEPHQLTPKVTESPAPTLTQYNMPPRPNNFKHHLDDSEIKKALWSQRETPQLGSQTGSNGRQNTCVSVHSNTERTVQSQSIEQSHRQSSHRQSSSPNFRIEESSQSEKKTLQTLSIAPSKHIQKENQNPQFAKKKRQRKLSSTQIQISKVPNYLKNIQSKIKEQVVQDKNSYRQEAKSIGQSQATFKQISEPSEQNIFNNESQCQTILPSELKQMLNPLNSLNTKPNNEGFEDFFQFSMKQPPLNQSRHQRYISQGTNSSNDNTPQEYAQSISLMNSSNNKKSQSSGKSRLIETGKKQAMSQLETSNKMIDIANSFLNSPFVKQLCTEGNVKQRLFKELSNIKENGWRNDGSEHHSSSSSNFSLFNPKDELKSREMNDLIFLDFFQKEFLERKHQMEDERRQFLMNLENSSNMSFTV